MWLLQLYFNNSKCNILKSKNVEWAADFVHRFLDNLSRLQTCQWTETENAARALGSPHRRLPPLSRPSSSLPDPAEPGKQIRKSVFSSARSSLVCRLKWPDPDSSSFFEIRVFGSSPSLYDPRDHGRVRADLFGGRPVEIAAKIYGRIYEKVWNDKFQGKLAQNCL